MLFHFLFCFAKSGTMETQLNGAHTTHVGIPPVVPPNYGKPTHPKPHKKMIIEKYIPTIEAAQKVVAAAEEALIIHVEKSGKSIGNE